MFDNIWKPNGTVITRRYVASLDVLGFKQRLASDGLTKLFSDYAGLQVHARGPGTKFTVLGTLFGQTVGVTKAAPYLLVSDGILLWCDENGDVDTFVRVCAALVADSIRRGLPLRGAIAFGETIIDPPSMTFLGQPMVDAHLSEQAQEWVGVALHPNAEEALTDHEDVAKYAVPAKPGSTPLGYALTWHHYMLAHDALQALERLKATAGSSVSKYERAAEFVRALPLDARG